MINRYYSAVSAFKQLYKNGIYAVGTVMSNRKGLSKLAILDDKQAQNVEKGSLYMAKQKISQDCYLTQLAWNDTKPVHILSTGISNEHTYIRRRNKKTQELEEINACNIISMYHKYMGGIVIFC